MELSNMVDTAAFSLRVAQADMARVPDILEAVPAERVQQMQVALAKVWHRCAWAGFGAEGRARVMATLLLGRVGRMHMHGSYSGVGKRKLQHVGAS